MSGINQEIFLDSRHLSKHLPNTAPVQNLLRRGRAVHIFKNKATMLRVAKAIIEKGNYTGKARNYERYGLLFSDPIGDRVAPNGSRIPLFYGEVKINEHNKYHPIPRTGPSQE